MKKYQLLESWHNGGDNGTEVIGTYDNLKDAQLRMADEAAQIELQGLGDEFKVPEGRDYTHSFLFFFSHYDKHPDVFKFRDDKPLIRLSGLKCKFWYGSLKDNLDGSRACREDDYGFWCSEYRRGFEIHEVECEAWDFRYDEEMPEAEGGGVAGILSDGSRFLFFRVFPDHNGEMEMCHIYDSIRMTPENEICHYPWTSGNDSKVLETLDGLEDESDWCGEHCPLRTLAFDKTEE